MPIKLQVSFLQFHSTYSESLFVRISWFHQNYSESFSDFPQNLPDSMQRSRVFKTIPYRKLRPSLDSPESSVAPGKANDPFIGSASSLQYEIRSLYKLLKWIFLMLFYNCAILGVWDYIVESFLGFPKKLKQTFNRDLEISELCYNAENSIKTGEGVSFLSFLVFSYMIERHGINGAFLIQFCFIFLSFTLVSNVFQNIDLHAVGFTSNFCFSLILAFYTEKMGGSFANLLFFFFAIQFKNFKIQNSSLTFPISSALFVAFRNLCQNTFYLFFIANFSLFLELFEVKQDDFKLVGSVSIMTLGVDGILMVSCTIIFTLEIVFVVSFFYFVISDPVFSKLTQNSSKFVYYFSHHYFGLEIYQEIPGLQSALVFIGKNRKKSSRRDQLTQGIQRPFKALEFFLLTINLAGATFSQIFFNHLFQDWILCIFNSDPIVCGHRFPISKTEAALGLSSFIIVLGTPCLFLVFMSRKKEFQLAFYRFCLWSGLLVEIISFFLIIFSKSNMELYEDGGFFGFFQVYSLVKWFFAVLVYFLVLLNVVSTVFICFHRIIEMVEEFHGSILRIGLIVFGSFLVQQLEMTSRSFLSSHLPQNSQNFQFGIDSVFVYIALVFLSILLCLVKGRFWCLEIAEFKRRKQNKRL